MEDESGQSVQEPPTDQTPETATAPDTGGPAPKRPLPPWAWAVIALAAVLVLAGTAWSLYESGRSAGLRDASGSGETSATNGRKASAAADVSVAELPTENTPPEEPVETAAEDAPPAADPEPTADTPASNPPPATISTLTLGPQYKYTPKLYTVPTTWKVIFNHSNTGPWEMPYPPGIVLTKGYLRMTVLATDNANNSGYVQLKRVDGGTSLPNYGILYDWAGGSGNVIYKVTDPVLVEAGTYQLRVSIHGPWTIVLEK